MSYPSFLLHCQIAVAKKGERYRGEQEGDTPGSCEKLKALFKKYCL